MSEVRTTIEESLKRMYELGVEHGRQLAEKDLTIRALEEETGKLLALEKGLIDTPEWSE